jgi:hypothetical protein
MFTILSYLQTGYVWLMPLLLLMHAVIPAKRNDIKSVTGIANSIMLFVLGIDITWWLSEFFIAWYGQNQYEQYTFSRSSFTLTAVLSGLADRLLIFILLLFKKLRSSVWLSIGVWLNCFNFFIFGTVSYVYMHLNRDYLPSSWSTYHTGSKWIETTISILLFAAVSALIYWCKKIWPVRKAHDAKN